MPRYQKAKSVLEAARQLGSEAAKHNLDARQSSSLLGREIERGVESNKADLDVKMQRYENAKSVSEAAKQLRSEAAKCNILISPLEGEKKFLSELCELRNFREGDKKYKYSDRATIVRDDMGQNNSIKTSIFVGGVGTPPYNWIPLF